MRIVDVVTPFGERRRCGGRFQRNHSMSIQQEVRKFLMRRRFLWLHWALSDDGRVETCIANATPLTPSRLPEAHQCDETKMPATKVLLHLASIAAMLAASAPFEAFAQVATPQTQAAKPSGATNSSLKAWIENDLTIFEDRKKAFKLFFRRTPVRFALLPNHHPVADEAFQLAGTLAKGAGLSHEATTRDPNLVVIIDTPVNEGDKPNRELWRKYGLPDDALKIVSERGGWSSGCGNYSFRDADGNISMSVVLADSTFSEAVIRACVVEGTIASFGLRQGHKSMIRIEDGYLQYVLLVRALRTCDSKPEFQSSQSKEKDELKNRYTNCVLDYFAR